MMVTCKTFAAVLALVLSAGPVLADAIDGDWCHTQHGRHFSIRGPEIVTPGGQKMQADYNRHFFSYAVPVPEPGAGQTVFMTLVDENTIHLRLGTNGGTEVWLRCQPSVSGLQPLPVG